MAGGSEYMHTCRVVDIVGSVPPNRFKGLTGMLGPYALGLNPLMSLVTPQRRDVVSKRHSMYLDGA